MGLLSSPRALGALAVGVAGVVTVVAVVSACQAVVGSDSQYFDSAGVTTLAQFSDFDGVPGSLVLAGNEVFFLEGPNLFAVARTGDATATAVHVFTGTPTSLAYDGADLLYACDSAVGLIAWSITDRADVVPPFAANAACFAAVASPDEVAYATQTDGGGQSGSEVSLVIATASGENAAKPLAADPTDVALGADGDFVFGSVLQKIRALENGELCTLAQIGPPVVPKIVAAHRSDGGAQLLARGHDDHVRFVDEDQVCCEVDASQPACSAAPASGAIIPLNGDFTVAGNFVYWSQDGTISRQSLDAFPGDAGAAIVASTGQSANTIPSLVADGSYVYFVLGPRVLRAPLPPMD